MKKFSILIAACLIIFFAIVSICSGVLAMGKVFGTNSPQEQELARSLSLQYLEQRLSRYGISSIDDLKIMSVEIDELGMAHTRVQQSFNGVPVFGGEAIVHLNSDASVFAFTDSFVKDVQIDTQPKITQDEAIKLAITEFGCVNEKCLSSVPQASLVILPYQRHNYLAYRVLLERVRLEKSNDSGLPPSVQIYFIDAYTGKTVWNYENLQTQAMIGSGNSLYSGPSSVSLNTWKSGIQYYLEDHTSRKVATFNAYPTVTYLIDNNNTWGETTDPLGVRPGIDAHFAGMKTIDYYSQVHARNGIDGTGGPLNNNYTSIDGVTHFIPLFVHYSPNGNTSFQNAVWSTALGNNYAAFGDGDGCCGSTQWVSLDIVGHELTHGVIQFTANLIYANESGALNESFADIFGNMIERRTKGETANTWKVFEDGYSPFVSGDALRYMDNPHLANSTNLTADDDPDHISEIYQGSQDNGGIHVNSGVSNNVFYHLAKGGSNHIGGAMIPSTGIGADATEKIFYKALKSYMTSNTTFCGARQATINAVKAVYPGDTTKLNAVKRAWEISGLSCSFCCAANCGTVNCE
ncbi:MAG: M4 family metallopeptidase [Acidobacteriota bacterium]